MACGFATSLHTGARLPHLLTTAIWGAVLRFIYLSHSMYVTMVFHPVKQIYRGPLQRGAKLHVASDSHSTQPFTRNLLKRFLPNSMMFKMCQEHVSKLSAQGYGHCHDQGKSIAVPPNLRLSKADMQSHSMTHSHTDLLN